MGLSITRYCNGRMVIFGQDGHGQIYGIDGNGTPRAIGLTGEHLRQVSTRSSATLNDPGGLVVSAQRAWITAIWRDWNTLQVKPAAPVLPAAQADFTFNVPVPAPPTVAFRWQMGTANGSFGPLSGEVTVNITAKPAKVRVPDVRRSPKWEAEEVIKDAGLVPAWTGIVAPTSIVSVQTPQENTPVERGSTVTCRLNRPPPDRENIRS
jgi:hypothetical protein